MAEPHHHVVFFIAIALAALAAWFDWRKGEIPNWVTLPPLLVGPALHFTRYILAKEPAQTALYESAFSVGGAALCALVPLIMFRQSAMGGGDLKLLVALGALLQPMLGVEAQMYGLFAGAILAPAALAYQGKLLTTLKNALTIGANMFLPKERRRSVDAAALSSFRLGPAVLIGVVLTAYLHW